MSDREAKKAEVTEALRAVRAPGMTDDVVTLGWVTDIAECDGAVKATVDLPIPGEHVQTALKAAISGAISGLGWPTAANVKVNYSPSGTTAELDGEDPLGTVKNVIAVASGKGGVGKSTVAVNLAAALTRAGATAGILDADIYGPSIPTMLGVVDGKPQPVEGPGGKQMFGPIRAHGMPLMSMGFMVEQDKPIIWRGPMLHGALQQFFKDVAWGELDYLIIDLPPGTGDVSLTMAQTITLTGAVVVSTPQEVAMVDARKAIGMFAQTNIHVLGLVENMAGEIFGEGKVGPWSEANDHRFLGALPLMAGVRESGDNGIPAALSDDDAIARPFRDLADQVAAAAAARNAAQPQRKRISLQG